MVDKATTDSYLLGRQGGASSLCCDEARGLRFDTQDDALDHVGRLVQDGNDWLAGYDGNFAKAYIGGQCHIHADVACGRCGAEYNFVCRKVDLEGKAYIEHSVGRDVAPPLYGADRKSNSVCFRVLVRVTDRREGVEEVVPSLVVLARRVALESFEEGMQFSGDIFAGPFLEKQVIEVGFRSREGEVDFFPLIGAERNRSSPCGLIERATQICDDVGCFGTECFGRLSNLDSSHLEAGISLHVLENAVSLFVAEHSEFALAKIGKVFPCLSDPVFGTGEIGHGTPIVRRRKATLDVS